MLKLRKSEIPWDLASLIKKKVIKMDDLEGFSEDLIVMVQRLLNINA